jgi:NAD(P)-dependent dehydrogenase (short-subunit alcohol dehydrogenase family)
MAMTGLHEGHRRQHATRTRTCFPILANDRSAGRGRPLVLIHGLGIGNNEGSGIAKGSLVAPRPVATEMGQRLVRAMQAGATLADIGESSPFGRVCTPEDVAGVIAFLVSADAGHLTGQRVAVDGGGPEATVL